MSDPKYSVPLDDLIPQRPPFVLVDKITNHSGAVTESVFHVDPGHILIEDGVLSAYGLLENMAQSAALMSGYEAHISDKKPKTGYIGTITNSNIYSLPAVNTEINTRVVQTTQIMNIIVIECTAYSGEVLLADCSMKIVLMDEGTSS